MLMIFEVFAMQLKQSERKTWGPFLESPENFSGPKSHSIKYDLLTL